MPNSMIKNKEETTPKSQKKALAHTTTHEATSYLQGLFQAFRQQTRHYAALTQELLSLEARIELAEKNLCLTRDHFKMTIENTDNAAPNDWDAIFKTVRFVGVRLVDACATLLQESKHQKLTPEELLSGLNFGTFRFRTNSPLREIHAALLKHPSVKRTDDAWVWTGTAEQIPLRLRVMKATMPQDEVAQVK